MKSQSEKIAYRADKDKVFELLGNRCARCGFDDRRALQINRIDGAPRGNNNNRAYYREILNALVYYQLLCANCGLIKRAEETEL